MNDKERETLAGLAAQLAEYPEEAWEEGAGELARGFLATNTDPDLFDDMPAEALGDYIYAEALGIELGA